MLGALEVRGGEWVTVSVMVVEVVKSSGRVCVLIRSLYRGVCVTSAATATKKTTATGSVRLGTRSSFQHRDPFRGFVRFFFSLGHFCGGGRHKPPPLYLGLFEAVEMRKINLYTYFLILLHNHPFSQSSPLSPSFGPFFFFPFPTHA